MITFIICYFKSPKNDIYVLLICVYIEVYPPEMQTFGVCVKFRTLTLSLWIFLCVKYVKFTHNLLK